MTDKIAATPGPWVVSPRINENGEKRAEVIGADGKAVTGWGCVTQTEANAERIVLAVNAHDDLLAALEIIATTAEDMGGKTPAQRCAMIADLARAALAKAQPR